MYIAEAMIKSLALIACLYLGACGSIPAIPVAGEFFGEPVDTTVDSEIARHYLENYHFADNKNREMDNKISSLYSRTSQSVPSRDELKTISQHYSVDFAALFLADRLLNDKCNREINQAFAKHLNNETAINTDISAYRVLFVPGWDYAETGHFTGADFARPRELANEFGLENYFVKLPPTGGVEENAAVLAADISRHIPSNKKLILVGASSAGPAIHLALSNLFANQQQGRIAAWLNLGGILQGSPIVDHYQVWYRHWLLTFATWHKGWDKQAILSMGTRQSRKRYARLQVDPDILVINYIGIPLSGQISRYSVDNYPILRSEGPNDGLTLITDAIAPNSLTIVALGSDHFFAEDPRIDQKTVALMKLLITYLEEGLERECGDIASHDAR
ncbi:MAG: hypothetical protein AB2792_18175 [Candidatus Thiodiazotropha sp.]